MKSVDTMLTRRPVAATEREARVLGDMVGCVNSRPWRGWGPGALRLVDVSLEHDQVRCIVSICPAGAADLAVIEAVVTPYGTRLVCAPVCDRVDFDKVDLGEEI